MDYTLRPYQEDVLKVIWDAIPTDQFILIQAATGAGKTLIFSELIKRLLTQWPNIRIGILAHRRELITQAQDKLLKTWPEAPIGIACASISNDIDTDKPVVIGSIQTLSRRTGTTVPFDLVIVDETHKIPAMNVKSQYKSWIETMIKYNPKVRIIGFSATCFRLSHGYIYGTACKPGNINLFPDLHYRISISDLQKDGYLCGYRAKTTTDISSDLAGVRKTGDYNVGDLSAVMSKQQHVGSAVAALNEHASDRKHVIVFAVTIAHAEKLREAFGEQATIIHSELNDDARYQALSDFESGKIRIIVNVTILSEGFDSPAVDCIIMCRPTMSPGLFIQMTGRGLRPHPDKKDVLILDLANNCQTHGDPDSPRVEIPGRSKKKELVVEEKKIKTCPNCDEVVEPRATECEICGWTFIQERNDPVVLTDYQFVKQKSVSMIAEISDIEMSKYISKKGNLMIKAVITAWVPGSINPHFINHFMMLGDDNHPYGISRSRAAWRKVTGDDPPTSAHEGIERKEEFESALGKNGWVSICEENKFMKIERWCVPPPSDYLMPIQEVTEAPLDEDQIPF
ncbi:MAG: DEAD/DEAH box helicase [Deltaproteobacteria bacterium]